MVDRDAIIRQPVVYRLPGMDEASVRRDLPYRTVAGEAMLADIYRPAGIAGATPLPTVIFIHGDGPPEFGPPKAWGQYRSWGRLAAASGLAGVTFNHRPSARLTRLDEAGDDVEALLAWIRTTGADYGLATDRLCLWSCSAGVPYGMRAALSGVPGIRCAIAYYGLLDLRQLRVETDAGVTDATLDAFSALVRLEDATGPMPPLLVAKAGHDRAAINESIDRFVAAAWARGTSLEYHEHETGRHGFDVFDDDDRSRAIIGRTLAFMREHLAPDSVARGEEGSN